MSAELVRALMVVNRDRSLHKRAPRVALVLQGTSHRFTASFRLSLRQHGRKRTSEQPDAGLLIPPPRRALYGIDYALLSGMKSSPTDNQESNIEADTSNTLDRQVIYRVYDDEQAAANAAQLLVESGFPPRDVYVGVEREGQLQRAYTGWAIRLGIATSFGAAVSCILGMLLVTSAAVGLISMPLGPLAGLSAISASILSFIPSAIPGALVGWLVAALLWRRGAPNFPARQASKRAFVGVEVGPGNVFTAEHSMLHSRSTSISKTGGWPTLASSALQSATAT